MTRADRVAERMRMAVRVEAMRRAREEVKAQIRREGRIKLCSVPSREITAMAEAYVLAHRELIAEARARVEQWAAEEAAKRAALSVRKVPELRTLQAAPACTNPGETVNERGSANSREPNTAPTAECGLSPAGVSDRGRGREIDRGCTQAGRNGPRDGAAILLAYRHGLRAAELCQLRWSQIDLRQGRLHVNRAKGGCASVHPLHGPRASGATTVARRRPVCVRDRSRHASDDGLVPADGPADWHSRGATLPGASAYAAAFDWIQTGQRWSRYAIAGALSRASELTIDRSVYGVGRRQVREILVRLGRICRRF